MATKKATKKIAKAAKPAKALSAKDQRSAEEQVRAVRRICRGPISAKARDSIAQALARGSLAEARQLDAEGRQACGYDLTDLIAKHPFDGEEFTVKCPKCGLESSHRAATFDA